VAYPTVQPPLRRKARSPLQSGTSLTVLVIALLVAIALAVAGVLAFEHGITSSSFPSYVEGEPEYSVVRYSGPWITGGIFVVGAAMLVLGMVGKTIASRISSFRQPVHRSYRGAAS
jgi:hypothetical protein